MVVSSRLLALLLALCIASVTTAFITLANVSSTVLIITFLICFSASYILGFIVLEFLIFREINQVKELLEKFRVNEFDEIDKRNHTALSPLKQVSDEIYTYVSSKQIEINQLKKAEAFRKEFIADVSHELKTPIFAAQGFIHTLIDGAIKDKSVRLRFLKKAAKSLDGLDLLVQDLLTLSQIETGEIKMHYEYFDIRRLTEDVFEQFETRADKKDITTRVAEGAADEVKVHGDWKRINQVMTNLVSNAIKYSNEGGLVEVKFEKEDDSVIISVSDKGDGIPETDVNRIFERFYRVDKSRSREKGGTGLGLAIVKHIAEGHNTKVEVESKLGEGSVFTFRLESPEEEEEIQDESDLQ